jgi:hypothetical protein
LSYGHEPHIVAKQQIAQCLGIGVATPNAVDRGDECNAYERSHPPKGRWINATRWSLLKAPDKQSIPQLALLGAVAQANTALVRGSCFR